MMGTSMNNASRRAAVSKPSIKSKERLIRRNLS